MYQLRLVLMLRQILALQAVMVFVTPVNIVILLTAVVCLARHVIRLRNLLMRRACGIQVYVLHLRQLHQLLFVRTQMISLLVPVVSMLARAMDLLTVARLIFVAIHVEL